MCEYIKQILFLKYVALKILSVFFYPNISDQVILFPLTNKEIIKREYKLLLLRVAQTYLIHNVTPDKSEFRACDPKALIDTYTELYAAYAD